MAWSTLIAIGLFWLAIPDSKLAQTYAPPNREALRKAFREIGDDKKRLDVFLASVEEYVSAHPHDTAAEGFRATGELMALESLINPLSKYGGFVRWKEVLEQAILNHPSDLDLRFFRLTVQLNTPIFLNYRGSIEDDSQLVYFGIQSDIWPSDKAHANFAHELLVAFELITETSR
jgi:hypothetical protein